MQSFNTTMAKHKLQRFADLKTFSNVFELDECKLKGIWNKEYFKNNHPIVLELGCGRGEYTINMAQAFPEKNFIGIDYKGARLWRGAKTAIDEKKSNVAFLRIQIENLVDFFAKDEVSEIWITFPDPQPQISREKKRLTSSKFLEKYQNIITNNGLIHLKTDNDGLYNYTLDLLQSLHFDVHCHTNHLYHSDVLNETLSIKTTYEKIYLSQGKNINYLCFSVSKSNINLKNT